MTERKIYVEGGGNSEELQARCREGFRKLLEKSGFVGRAPRIVACGGRSSAFDAFKTAHKQGKLAYVALIVDSEDPVADPEQPWQHLENCDGWQRPAGATDEQVFLMTTCMETWILADRAGLQAHYGAKLQTSSLPSLTNIESKNRRVMQDALAHATRHCTNAYAKNKRSFDALAAVSLVPIETQLPAFQRMRRILSEKL